MAIFTHVTVGTNDLAKARLFYDGVLAPLGYKRLNDLGENGSIWGEFRARIFRTEACQRKPCDDRQRGHHQFPGTEPSGGRGLPQGSACCWRLDEGAVGPRGWAPNVYAGYARDLDGNKIAAYCFVAD